MRRPLPTEVFSVLENPLLRAERARQRARVLNAFPHLKQCNHQHFLALARYVTSRPERYFASEIYDVYLDWLMDRETRQLPKLRRFFRDNRARLSRALLFCAEVCRRNEHEDLQDGDEYDLVRFLDGVLHPSYLRLLEGALYPFIYGPALFSREDRQKGTDRLDLFNAVDELQHTPLTDLQTLYNNVVRNAIAHGGIGYGQNEIVYWDKKSNEEKLDHQAVFRMFDDLVDACNAIAAALTVFHLARLDRGLSIPEQILLEELQAETQSPWWQIEGCVSSRLPRGQKQLLVYARPGTSDYQKVSYSTIVTGVLAEYLAPGYDRYFLSLHSTKAWRGFAGFDGRKLRRLHDRGVSSLEEYQGVLEDPGVFYVPGKKLPSFLYRIDNLRRAFASQWAIARRDFRRRLGRFPVQVRLASIHRNGLYSVVNASVVIDTDDFESGDQGELSLKSAVGTAVRYARRQLPWFSPLRHLRLGYANVAVFAVDFRKRRLRNYGLGEHLIGTIKLQRLKRIKSPDLLGSETQQQGKYRVAWNRAWLDAQEDASSAPP